MVLMTPMLVNAEIYKWKDKNGVMRYSDKKPPKNVRVDTIRAGGVSKGKQPVGDTGANTQMVEKPADGKTMANEKADKLKDATQPDAEAESVRAKNEEIEKRNIRVAAEEKEWRASNCTAAKANYRSFDQGGRIYKTNEAGERQYLDSAGIAAAKKKAKASIDKFC